MHVLLKATYPPTSAKQVTEVFMSPKTPKRSDAAKEIASFAYGDDAGYHGLFILEVEDTRFPEFMRAQTARNAYMQSRADGLRVEVIPGLTVADAIGITAPQLG
jgi:hypothetical protein